VVGRTAVEIGLWPDEVARAKALHPLKVAGRVREIEVALVMGNGAHRLMCMNAVLVTVKGDSYVLIYLRDVTADRMAQAAVQAGEQALAQTNEKLNRQVTLHQMTESVAKVDPGDTMVHLSHGYCEIGHLGDAHMAPLGEHLHGVAEEDRDIVKRALKQMNGEIVEYRWRRPDGNTIWLRSRMQRQIVHGVVKADIGVVQDISGEREALQAAADQLAAAQRSEARFRSLTELSSDWYWEQDAEFRFIRVDGDVDVSRSLTVESVVGTTRWDSGVEGVSPAQWASHRAALEAHETFHDFEMFRRREDGSAVWVSISGAPIFDNEGVFAGRGRH
jgi:PAS domain S-box-containing protein